MSQQYQASQAIQPMNVIQNTMLNYDQGVVVSIYIRKLVLRESGTYNDQFTRPFEAHLNPQSVNALTNRAAEQGMNAFKPSSLSGLASNMISVSAAPESTTPIEISNGWNSSRLLFFMDVLTVGMGGEEVTWYIQGYTNYVGLSLQSKSLDPSMVFYINNIVVAKEQKPHNTPHGMVRGRSLVQTDHMLYNMQPDPNNQQWVMRPQDIFQVLTSTNVSRDAQGPYGGETPKVLDYRNRLQSSPHMSRRTNAIASNYASHLVNGFIKGASRINPSDSATNAYEQATEEAGENTLSLNPFLMALSKKRSSGYVTGTFYWRDILALDPNVTNVITVTATGPTQKNQPHMAGQTESWQGANIETKYAATLSQAIPALMLECMLYQVAFTTNNMMRVEGNMNGIYTVMSNAVTISGGVAIREAEMFKARLENEVLRDISYNNQQKFDMRVQSSVFGETWVSVSIDGGPYIDFVTPTFCDGVITPVLTHSYGKIENMASSVDMLVSQVSDAMYQDRNERSMFSMPGNFSNMHL